MLKKVFATGCSVVKAADNVEEIDIQGDVKDDILPFIVKQKWAIPKESVFFVDGGKRFPAWESDDDDDDD